MMTPEGSDKSCHPRQGPSLAWVIYNAVGIPIAAGALYPLLGLRLSPMIAAAAMALSSLSVVGNANRLRRLRIQAPSPAQPADIEPIVETFPPTDAQNAIEQTRKNEIRYRAVIKP